MKRKILAIGIILVITAAVFMCGCVEEELFPVTYPITVKFVGDYDSTHYNFTLTLYEDSTALIITTEDGTGSYGTWDLTSTPDSKRKYRVYISGNSFCFILHPNGEAILVEITTVSTYSVEEPKSDHVRFICGNWYGYTK